MSNNKIMKTFNGYEIYDEKARINKVDLPIDSYGNVNHGNDGQVLISKGNGKTEWKTPSNIDGGTGQDGASAYDIAVTHGFEGNEEEWLESLKGKDGSNGANGTDGKDGKDGTNGSNGADGEDGVGIETIEQMQISLDDNGENILKITLTNGQIALFKVCNGSKGSDGADGKNGVNGVSPKIVVEKIEGGHGIMVTDYTGTQSFEVMDGQNGVDGKDGYTPVKGVDYFDGQDGAKGDKGETGARGIQGEQGISVVGAEINSKGELVLIFSNNQRTNVGNVIGAKGEKGDKGEAGAQGIQGIQGVQGDKGDKGEQGAQGEKGDKGDVGAQGVAGKDGVSVAKTEINNKGELVITLSDNTVSNLGVIIGAKGEKGDKGDTGEQGEQGVQGEKGDKGETGENGKDGSNGTDGVDGFSPIANVTQTASGATISIQDKNGTTTATVKNGKDGEDGKDGSDASVTTENIKMALGYTPAKQTDVDSLSKEKVDESTFNTHVNNTSVHVTSAEKQVWNNKADASQLPTITQEAGESESLVMSQKAVTDLVNNALAEIESTEYETVDSVDEMIDKTKQYVLSTTGTLWACRPETSIKKIPNFTNLIKFGTDGNPTNVTLNKRLNSSGGTSDQTGGFVINDYIHANGVSIDKIYINQKPSGQSKVTNYTNTSGTMGGKGNATISSWTQEGDYYVTNAFDGALESGTYLKFSSQLLTTALTNDNLKGLIVTHDEPITYTEKEETVEEWYDTEITPEQASTNYVDLLVKVNKNTSDISDVNVRVAKLETGNESLTIPSFWQDAVDECIAKIKGLQVGRNCLTFPFFSDNHQRNGYAGRLIAYIMKECNIPYCFYGGDSISSGTIADEATMIEQDKAFDTIMSYVPNGRLCRAVGNHDGYWYDGTNKYYYTDTQIYDLFLREESIAQNKHFGGDGTYYYVDDVASKTRFIVLDTNDSTVEAEQLTWLQNTALSFNESGWAVVFISHQPISNHYHANITNAQEVRNIVKNYINGSSANKADVVGWYSGHIHRDRIYTGIATNSTDDTQGTAMGFTQVTTTSDHTGIAYDDATKHTVAEDNKSHAIDFVTINKNTRTVNITRLGIGSDRSYTY